MKSVRTLLAVILATSAISATSVTAFAAISTPTATQSDVSSTEASLQATGDIAAPTISINVPTTMDYLLNPYQIEGKAQILSPKFTIENKSDVPIDVLVAECKPGTVPSSMKLVEKVPTDKATEKEAYVYLRATVGDDVGTGAFKKGTDKAAGDVLVSATALANPVLLASLNAGTGSAAAATGGKASGSFLGTLSTPKEAPWGADDKFDITVVYKFVPKMNPAATTP